MLIELDMLVFNVLAGMGLKPEEINQRLEPVRFQISALAVALGIEDSYASLFTNNPNDVESIKTRLYEVFKQYLASKVKKQ